MLKRLLFIVSILSQVLLATDTIVFHNLIEYEGEFIRFVETKQGIYIEVKVGENNNINCVPVDQVLSIKREDGTYIYNEGKILDESLKAEPIRTIHNSRFPLEVQNINPTGVHIIASFVSIYNNLSFSPHIKMLKNEPDSRFFRSIACFYYSYEMVQGLVPELMVGMKGNQNVNYFIRNSLDIVFKEADCYIKDNRTIFGITRSFRSDSNELILLDFGLGNAVSKDENVFLLLLGTGLVINNKEDDGIFKPTSEFVIDLKNKDVVSRVGISFIF